MNSLRARIAAVLLGAIVFVVGLATLAAVWIGQRNAEDNIVGPIAGQIRYLGEQAEAPVRSAPLEGSRREDIAARLEAALARSGRAWRVVVAEPAGADSPLASVEIAPARWLTLPVPRLGPPPDAWKVLIGWMSLIFIGVAGVSLALAHRLTRPLALLEDIAARIEASGEIETAPETGPAEVQATARALNRLSLHLSRAVESRMRLVAAAGHDLRTPLTRMRLRAEFLADAERAKWLKDIDELERIAESAIALVREETGAHQREPIDLAALVRTIAADLAGLGLRVVVGEMSPVRVEAPPLALTRALRNLIVNAATHGGGARVSVSGDDDRAVVAIEDDGPGIPEADIGRVFEPFYRADRARRQTAPGAGLGLAIAKEIIARAGGTLTLANRARGGLRQVIAFPARPD